MADQKLEIIFNKSMIGDKRNRDFAYLRKGIFNSQTPGLYPSRDFVRTLPQDELLATDHVVDILGDANTGLKVIVEGTGSIYRFYDLGSDVTSNDDFDGNILALAYGDGVLGGGVYLVDDTTEKVYEIYTLNTNIVEIGTFASNPDVEIGGYDGLYFWWAGSKIWKQLPGQSPVLAFSATGIANNYLKFMDFYEDQIILFAQKDNDIYIYFWDKSDTTLFQKRIIIKNSILVGGGVIDDTLMLIRSEYDYTNRKEREGKMIISGWNGVTFKELNSIPTGRGNVTIPSSGAALNGASCRCNSEYMLLAVDNNDDATKNADLYNNYVYKIYKTGGIEALVNPVANGSYNFADIVAFGRGFHAISVPRQSVTIAKIYIDEDDNDSFNEYNNFINSEYITNFYCNPFNYHKLDAINISFEKLFRNNALTPDVDEELDIYYRTSDRLGWTLLGAVTAQKVIDNVNKRLDQTNINTTYPVNEQRYQITRMPDGTALPEFNEIQFKFLSKKGFSIIGAWFDYSYITRNMIK